ncbi:MAG: actin-binding WH2 domain-containing protein [Chloroflexota bacterium]
MKDLFTLMPDFLRDPDGFFQGIREGKEAKDKAIKLALISIISLAIYGFTVGLAKSPLQALSSAGKLPILFLLTMAFCLPSLYFFSLTLLRTPLNMLQVQTVVLTGIAVTSFLLLGLAPISLFFVMTSSNYPFFQLLAVLFVGVSALIGVYFLWRGMTLIELGGENAPNQLGQRILVLWFILYAFVGTQMTWRLSPFIGRPEDPFYLLRPSRDNFYVDVLNALQGALNIEPTAISWLTPVLLGGLCLLSVGGMIFFSGLFFGKSAKRQKENAQLAG